MTAFPAPSATPETHVDEFQVWWTSIFSEQPDQAVQDLKNQGVRLVSMIDNAQTVLAGNPVSIQLRQNFLPDDPNSPSSPATSLPAYRPMIKEFERSACMLLQEPSFPFLRRVAFGAILRVRYMGRGDVRLVRVVTALQVRV